jgi:hypothetical protein
MYYDCSQRLQSVSDLSLKLWKIPIEKNNLNFGFRIFKNEENNDVSDECIYSNLFPQGDAC